MEIDEKKLFQIACKGVEDAVNGIYDPPSSITLFNERYGVFVTLTKKGQLRGCIGNIIPTKPLGLSVYENAIHAAIHDPRFPPLRGHELQEIEIEISILSFPKKLEYRDVDDLLSKLQPFKHGVIISYMGYSATFLPQVWEHLPNKEEFLSNLCLKAGLPSDIWKKEKIGVEIYENKKVIGPWRWKKL